MADKGLCIVRPGDAVSGETSGDSTAIIWNSMLPDIERTGQYFRDNFSGNDVTLHPWTLEEANGSINQLLTEYGSVLRLTTGGTDNDQACMYWGSANNAPFRMSTDNGRPLWFECRWRVNAVADDHTGIYIGLTEEAAGVADFIVDGGATYSATDRIGFNILAADGDQLETVMSLATAANTNIDATFATIVADTFYNDGFYFDGKKTVTFFHNGVPSGTKALTTDTQFPLDQELTISISAKTSTGTTLLLDIDWVACAQVGHAD